MKAQPIQSEERITSLDVLRGFAILGLLPINIQVFSMIGIAYMNPIAFGNFEGINRLLWILGHLLFDLKFLTIFTILFGAGLVLFTSRLETKGVKSLGIHYRRMLWLMLFGFAHAYLLWGGDILVAYAISGMLVVLLRNLKPGKLMIIGLLVFSVASLVYIVGGLLLPSLDAEKTQGLMLMWAPNEELITEELASFKGSWFEQMPGRIEHALTMQLFIFLFTGWRAGGLMIIGMALFKWGILSALKSKVFYFKLTLFCLLIGLFVVGIGLMTIIDSNFSMRYTFLFGSQFNYWGSVLISLGYIGLMMIWIKSNTIQLLRKSMQAVGKMAFTNYLMQSIICTTIFYGHGFGLIGQVDRWEQLVIVCGILIFQFLFSLIWLKYFRYGPFEWIWRSLTYWKVQPIRMGT
jgi:uncharacterized protein